MHACAFEVVVVPEGQNEPTGHSLLGAVSAVVSQSLPSRHGSQAPTVEASFLSEKVPAAHTIGFLAVAAAGLFAGSLSGQ